MHTGSDYWKNYMERFFGKALIDDWKKSCREITIQSNGETLHVETYHAGEDKPTLIFSHGIAGYARVLLPFILPLFHRNINIICPDLKGYGYNSGIKGDFTWDEHVTNLTDCARYAREKYHGTLFMGGASMGGPLAYEAAARFRRIDGLVCWCLWDMSARDFIENETRLGKKNRLALPFMKLAAKIAGSHTIPTTSVVSYDTLSAYPELNDMVLSDPQAGTRISIRAAVSLVTQSRPTLSYENFTRPILVFQPTADRMTPSNYTYETYLRIGNPDKRYIEVDGCEHFPVEKRCYDEWISKVSSFIKLNS